VTHRQSVDTCARARVRLIRQELALEMQEMQAQLGGVPPAVTSSQAQRALGLVSKDAPERCA